MQPRFAVIVALTSLSCIAVLDAADRKIEFNRDVRPILSNNCYLCHGPDKNQLQAGLRLDKRDDAIAKLESGHTAIVPHDAAASTLLERVTSSNPDEKMPPADSGKSLTPAEVEILKQWIAEGAEYQGHWSFLAAERRMAPATRFTNYVRNEIDQFILKKLENESLEPSPEADKITLIRRATIDLTGLPPTPAEVDAFLADHSQQAYERVIDRLLASTRYGEHQGRIWLDAARYGDTHGLHLDNERSLWPYRDYVISAFNRNLPFDQFAIEQLGGDLIPGATVEQKIASGFNRCNVTTGEGGSIDDEVLVRYAVDRTEALSTVFLGLTLQCAVCHSHKFDPVSQKEFYSLYSYFYSMADQAMDGNALLPPPLLKLPNDEQKQRQKGLNDESSQVQQTLVAELSKINYVDPLQGAEPAADALAVLRREVVWIDDDNLPAGAQLQGDSPWAFITKGEGPVYSGEKASKRTATALSQHFFTGANPGLKIGEGDTLFAYVYLDPTNPPKSIMLQFNDGTWDHRINWGDEDAIGFGAKNSTGKRLAGPLPKMGEWVRLEVSAADVGLLPGVQLNGWAFTQFGGTCYWDRAGAVTLSVSKPTEFDSQIAWERSEQPVPNKALPGPVQEALKVESGTRNADQQKVLQNYFVQYVNIGTKAIFAPLFAKSAELEKQKKDLDAAIPATMVSEDLAQPRDTFVLIRGAYDKKGEKVERNVPSILPPLPEGAPNNRLGLAKWLVAPNHPLTSRVIVNRYWQQFFGTGLVKTAEDFGAQGTWPTHPELLDWLSTEFIRTGWNIKGMHKLMLMSGTYRQSANVPHALQTRDPENLLLARGPRFRFDAEVIRDSILFSSGLLVERSGGKSVKPYQPEGIWEAVAFVGSNTREFRPDAGESLYRRSLYTFWKRTAPPPSMSTFDAPSRENCTVRRPRTNTPLQALALMNDRQYIDAARKLAERMMVEGGQTPDAKMTYGFRWVTARPPTAKELEVLLKSLEKQRAAFSADPASAEHLLAYGDSPRNTTLDPLEYAAWTMVANLMINLDETITK
ncbi:PSD1 and planctomycete cytochrome C domain-containing protein [Schlesneria paludicola]|uniref:PSD1 and planctomycete cytochrome C domain-containing protein n=1 Tax=Schlesneria paludicola TaxID=360056 RepID=UPI00029A31C6|nr:PSD1 and planctomycete cytochrome C domain-containing protein [Schlesneria paludicola]